MSHESPLEVVAHIIFLLAIILFVAKFAGEISQRYLKIPPVLGELIAGILISPYLLGGIHWFNSKPIFEIFDDGHSVLPVEPQLFFIAQMAAVILLFEVGLETDRKKFFQYIKPASAVALGGVFLPFLLGFFATISLGFASFDSINELIPALFVGAIMTATSVGISARVLTDMGKLSSPEGVTVLAAAVVDDVLGIVILAVVVGISADGNVTLSSIVTILLKALGFWLGLMFIGSLLASRISKIIMWFNVQGATIAIVLALALLAAAVAEIYFGLAMIIGAYTMGLALSDTDLMHHVEKPMKSINDFLVPIFFVVIGMQVDFSAFGSDPDVSLSSAIIFTAVLTFFAIFSKMFGSGFPALFVGFTKKGSYRIALGMLPRGEVALIIAGIGLSAGIIDQTIFGASLVMTVITTIIAPILLKSAFKSGDGVKK